MQSTPGVKKGAKNASHGNAVIEINEMLCKVKN
jgi:hypothetical protein